MSIQTNDIFRRNDGDGYYTVFLVTRVVPDIAWGFRITGSERGEILSTTLLTYYPLHELNEEWVQVYRTQGLG